METIMLDIMYDLPAIDGAVEVLISAGVVKGKAKAKVTPIEPEKLDAA
jgi:ATP-dependent protease Clp ATPase subunit